MAFGGNTTPKKKPKKEKASAWQCKCPIAQPGYMIRCSRCGAGRP